MGNGVLSTILMVKNMMRRMMITFLLWPGPPVIYILILVIIVVDVVVVIVLLKHDIPYQFHESPNEMRIAFCHLKLILAFSFFLCLLACYFCLSLEQKLHYLPPIQSRPWIVRKKMLSDFSSFFFALFVCFILCSLFKEKTSHLPPIQSRPWIIRERFLRSPPPVLCAIEIVIEHKILKKCQNI